MKNECLINAKERNVVSRKIKCTTATIAKLPNVNATIDLFESFTLNFLEISKKIMVAVTITTSGTKKKNMPKLLKNVGMPLKTNAFLRAICLNNDCTYKTFDPGKKMIKAAMTAVKYLLIRLAS